MAHRRASRGIALLALLCMCTAMCGAAPLVVPVGTAPAPPAGGPAKWQSLYPNPKITEAECRIDTLGPVNVIGIHAIKVPGTDQNIFMDVPNGGRPLENDGRTVVLFDVADVSKWTAIEAFENLFTAGQGFTPDGKIIVAGGTVGRNITIAGKNYTFNDAMTGIRVFDPREAGAVVARNANMSLPRWKPSLTLLPDGKCLIAGGVIDDNLRAEGADQLEIYDPEQPEGPTKLIPAPPAWLEGHQGKPFYPFSWVLPTGHVFMYADNGSCMLDPASGKCVGASAPGRPGGVVTHFPFSGSAVLGKLVPGANNTVNEVDVLVFGGSRLSDHPELNLKTFAGLNRDALGVAVVHRMTISWSKAGAGGWEYDYSDWSEEALDYPRVLVDATLLPNGDVVLTSGAQMGYGGFPVDGAAVSQFPAFWATLYQADAEAAGGRVTTLCGTEQPRLYHASATLTTNGTVLIGGADRNRGIPDAGVPWFNGTDDKEPPAYPVEVLHTPYSLDTDNKPAITSVAGAAAAGAVAKLAYDEEFEVAYSAGSDVTGAVLVAPSATSTSVNANQRVVELQVVTPAAGGAVTLRAPKDAATAPPQLYMLFLLADKTYSAARWVQLPLAA